MVTEHTGEITQEDAGGLAGVGARLSSTRKKQQLDLNAIAGELHLRIEVLRALEAGDEAGLPSPAFTRGYVRSYARVLGMDADELLAQLPRSNEDRVTPIGRAMGPRHRTRPQLAKLLLWLLVLGVTAGVVMYGVPVVERLMNPPDVETDAGQLTLPLADENPVPVDEVVVGPAQLAVPDEPEVTADVEPEQTAGPLAPADGDAPAATEEAPVEEDAPAQKPPVEEGPAEQQPPVAEAKSELLLRFHQDSWVEVDVDGRRLLAGIEPAGSERRLEAEPPIHVLLGNAPGVEVVYNGEVMDTASYRKGKVARIILEKN